MRESDGRETATAGYAAARWGLLWALGLGVGLCLGGTSGCGSDADHTGITGTDAGIAPDLSTEADGAPVDAMTDATSDTDDDAAANDDADASPDAATDTAGDAVSDAEADTASDAGTDASPDTTVDAAPDTAADTATDAGGGDLSLSDTALGEACSALCKQAADQCGDLSAVGGSSTACTVQCIDRASDDGWWLGNYQCFQLTCSADCFAAGAPVAAPASCDTFCAGMDACGFLPMIQLPDGAGELCRPLCAGAAATGPGAATAFQCADDALADGCSTGAVSACLSPSPEPTCEQICGAFYDPAAGQYCAPDTGWATAWPTAADCQAACALAGDAGATLNFTACTWLRDCGDPSPCADIGPDIPLPCFPFCQATKELCPDMDAGEAAFCPHVCAALAHTWGAEVPADAGLCVASMETCPADPGQTFMCLVEPSPACTAMCTDLDGCGFFQGADAPTADECALQCTVVRGEAPATWDPILACVAAGADCEAKAACIPQDQSVNPVCSEACEQTAACAGDPPLDVDACGQSCMDTLLSDGAAALSAFVCKALASCDGQAACDGVDAQAPPAACQVACQGADACADLAPGPGDATACERACAGALQGLGLSGAEGATCVVQALTAACVPSAADVCAPGGSTGPGQPAALDVQFQGFSGGGPGSGGAAVVYVRLREAGGAAVLASATALLQPGGVTVTFAEVVVGGTYDVEYALDMDSDGGCSDGDYAGIQSVGPLTGDTTVTVTAATATYDPTLCQTFYQ